ncbi:MAG: IS630 family transposase [Saprospiraceae bacterium]|nr:IS630 family transposase [Saprospiraceae bacterium]
MSITINTDEKLALKKLQKQVQERWLYVRITSILMLSEGFSVFQISNILGIDDNSVYRYQKAYNELDLTVFLSRDYQGYFGKLDSVQLGKLCAELNSKLYTSTQEVCLYVQKTFGVKYSCQGMCHLLERLGFSYKKTKSVPCKADKSKQEAFLEQLAVLLAEEDTVVYYTDGVHPTHNTRSLNGWILKGEEREIPTVSGRDRVNINGAVNARKPCEVFIEEGKTIDAQNTKALYEQLIQANPTAKKIYVIADNARYNRNKVLQEWLENTKIVQVFLPPYSPNLNLIERLWKFTRKKIIDPIFYRTKEEFRTAILSFFKNIDQFEQELETLMTLNFRTIHSQFN